MLYWAWNDKWVYVLIVDYDFSISVPIIDLYLSFYVAHKERLFGLTQRCEQDQRLERLLVRVDHWELVVVQGRHRDREEVHVVVGSAQIARSRVESLLQTTFVRYFQRRWKVSVNISKFSLSLPVFGAFMDGF